MIEVEAFLVVVLPCSDFDCHVVPFIYVENLSSVCADLKARRFGIKAPTSSLGGVDLNTITLRFLSVSVLVGVFNFPHLDFIEVWFAQTHVNAICHCHV